tara:strand:- start:206 stop:1216 length:1011 start_codon:yes stop_codon:yes gene_type:complete
MSHRADYNRINPSLRGYGVAEVLPQYFREEYPNLIAFMEAYYEYVDSDESISAIQDLFSVYDIESTSLTHLEYIFGTIADGANSTYFTEPREVLRNFANFYRVKGTKYSAEGFFRAFFGIDIEVDYPKNRIFKLNNSSSTIGTESLHFIQDGGLYQIFSVLIKSSVPLNTWRDLYKKFVHPAGFFLGGEVVLELPSINSELLVMPDNIDEPPPPLFVEGTANYDIPFGLVEPIGYLPDDADSDSVIERISLKATVGRYKDMPADVFAASYGRIDQAKDINSPTFDDSAKDAVYAYGVRMSNDIERMDRNRWFYDSAAGNPRYVAIGYVDSDYVELS